MPTVRLIIDAPLAGPINMGRDEALLDACCDSSSRPVIRLYAWQTPTISLGYFQDYAEYESLDGDVAGLDVVRRTTGGGAILHDIEITYSLTIPIDHPLVAGRPNRLYTLAHAAVIDAIGCGVRLFGCDDRSCDASAQRGPFFCFDRRHGLDVVVDLEAGRVEKITGSAQRRTRTAILQHGSIMLDTRFDQHPVATWSQLAGSISFDEAAARLIPAFEKSLGGTFVPDDWRDNELQAAERFAERYAGDAWTINRRRE